MATAYSKITFKDGQAPAIDAAFLNALGDFLAAIASGGSGSVVKADAADLAADASKVSGAGIGAIAPAMTGSADNYKTGGVFYCASTIASAPFSAKNANIIVGGKDASNCTQFAMSIDGGREIKLRQCVAGVWTSWSAVGGGGSSYGYISNGSFDDDLTGWTASGSNLTIARTTTAGEVLDGTASAKLSKPAVACQDEYISIPLTIALKDISQVMSVGFDYLAGSAYDGAAFGVVLYDVTNACEIHGSIETMPSGKGRFISKFVTSASLSYQLRFKVLTTSGVAMDYIVDNVSFKAEQNMVGMGIIERGVDTGGEYWKLGDGSVYRPGKVPTSTPSAPDNGQLWLV